MDKLMFSLSENDIYYYLKGRNSECDSGNFFELDNFGLRKLAHYIYINQPLECDLYDSVMNNEHVEEVRCYYRDEHMIYDKIKSLIGKDYSNEWINEHILDCIDVDNNSVYEILKFIDKHCIIYDKEELQNYDYSIYENCKEKAYSYWENNYTDEDFIEILIEELQDVYCCVIILLNNNKFLWID